jgi:hypothetical protein
MLFITQSRKMRQVFVICFAFLAALRDAFFTLCSRFLWPLQKTTIFLCAPRPEISTIHKQIIQNALPGHAGRAF